MLIKVAFTVYMYLKGIKSEYFGITQGVAQGYTLSLTSFLIFNPSVGGGL